MSEKIIGLPTIKNVDVTFSKEESLSLATENAFNKTVYSGDIFTNRGRFGGDINYWTIGENDLYATYETAGNLYFRAGKTNFADTADGFCIGIDAGVPKFVMGGATDSITMSAGNISITGSITATTGTIGGWTIGATTITGGTLTLNSAGSIYQGKTSFTDSTNPGYYFGSEGLYCGAATDATLFKYAVATGLIDLVGTISSRSTATIAAAINSSGNLVNDIINLRLDSSSKKILLDFTFGSTDYSGSLKCGTIAWNATTGAITGGTGGVFHKGGIVFAVAGVPTITLDGATGAATFAGILSSPLGNIGGCTLASNSITAGSSKILNECLGWNINGTWTVAYDAINIRTDVTTYFQGGSSIAFDIDVSANANDYAEILNSTMTSVDLSAWEGTGKFRVFCYIPDITYVTQLNLNWGSSDSDGWYQLVTTQANGQAFADGWNELEFSWNSGQSFGTPDSSAIVYAAFRITYSASQGDMQNCRLNFISACSGAGSFRTFALGTYGGVSIDDWGIRGYDASNNPTTFLSALSGNFYTKQGIFENVIVKARAGSNVFSFAILEGSGAAATVDDHQVCPDTSNGIINYFYNIEKDTAGGLFPSRIAVSNCGIVLDAEFNDSMTTGTAGSGKCGIVVLGSYVYACYSSGAPLNDGRWRRYPLNLSSGADMNSSGFANSNNFGRLATDGTNIYALVGTTSVKKYTISGTTITYNSTITLANAIKIDQSFWCDGFYFYGLDNTTRAVRKFTLVGALVSTSTTILPYYSSGEFTSFFQYGSDYLLTKYSVSREYSLGSVVVPF